jgi:hypothetical protein
MSTSGEIEIEQPTEPKAAGVAVDVKDEGSARIQVLRFVDTTSDDAPPEDRRRGLAFARRLAAAGELIRQARSGVERADGGGRKRCISGLERLWTMLHGLEQDALSSSGLTDGFVEDAEPAVVDVEDLLAGAAHRRKLKPRHVRRLRKEVRHASRRLESLLSGGHAPSSAP